MADPEASTETESDSDTESTTRKVVRGCGCTGGLLALALGILIIGNFDSGAWASALGAVVIGTLVFKMSGVNGFWEK